MVSNIKVAEITLAFRSSSQRLILLDFDGTLVNIQNHPSEVIPGKEVLGVIKQLASDKRNIVAILTGRENEYIDSWFGEMDIYIFAEHGSFIKEPGKEWVSLYEGNQDWKSRVLPILESYTKKVFGSVIEQKTSSIAWHYRNAVSKEIPMMVDELSNSLKTKITSRMNVNIMVGKKVIEIKQKEFDKGSATKKMMTLKPFQIIIAIGDDVTDEDMFKVLPPYAYTFKVGNGLTKAKMNIENPKEVIDFLRKLI
jgi:trehalose 6-phosphate synthase/phosphatase